MNWLLFLVVPTPMLLADFFRRADRRGDVGTYFGGKASNWRERESLAKPRFLSRVFLDFFYLCAYETQPLRSAFACPFVQFFLFPPSTTRSLGPAFLLPRLRPQPRNPNFVAVLLLQISLPRHSRFHLAPG